MAENPNKITQIQVGGITYDIVDATSHTAVSELTTVTNAITARLDAMWPVGSVFLSINNTNPSTFIGGTWESFTAGYALWTNNTASTLGTTASAGNTGSTTLTATQSGLPAHNFIHSHTVITNSDTHPYIATTSHGISEVSLNTNNLSSQFSGGQVMPRLANADADWGGMGSLTVPPTSVTVAAKNATDGHTHTAGAPNRVYVHAWKRVA